MRALKQGWHRRGGAAVSAETLIAGLVSFLLLVYLVYTLLRPEKF